MNATKALTTFYDETDGRLGSSAVVHLKAIEEPFRNFTVPYVRERARLISLARLCTRASPMTMTTTTQASKLQLACHSAREQYTKIFDTFQVGRQDDDE